MFHHLVEVLPQDKKHYAPKSKNANLNQIYLTVIDNIYVLDRGILFENDPTTSSEWIPRYAQTPKAFSSSSDSTTANRVLSPWQILFNYHKMYA